MCVVLTGRKLCGINKKVARNFPHLKAWRTSLDSKLLFRYSWKSAQLKKNNKISAVAAALICLHQLGAFIHKAKVPSERGSVLLCIILAMQRGAISLDTTALPE